MPWTCARSTAADWEASMKTWRSSSWPLNSTFRSALMPAELASASVCSIWQFLTIFTFLLRSKGGSLSLWITCMSILLIRYACGTDATLFLKSPDTALKYARKHFHSIPIPTVQFGANCHPAIYIKLDGRERDE